MKNAIKMTKRLSKLLEMYKEINDRCLNGWSGGRLFLEGEAEGVKMVLQKVYGVLPMCHKNKDGTMGYHLIPNE